MPSGAAVIKYEGKRGTVWRIKYEDAAGVQVQDTLGKASEGWNRRKAEAALRARLTDVERDGYRKPTKVTFEPFALEWNETYPPTRGLKRSTRKGYTSIINRHLIPTFGSLALEDVDVQQVAQYIAGKRRDGYAARTINRHLNLLGEMLDSARKRKLIPGNPVPDVDRPREPRRTHGWRILSPAEVARVEAAFVELAAEEAGSMRAWCEQARVVFVTVIGAGLRRSEVLGLYWRNVHLADPDGASFRVKDTWVLGAADTPKSETSERTISLFGKLAEELFEHRGRTAFAGDDDRVFCHPETGGVLDHKRYAETLRAALKRAGITDYVRPFQDGRHSSITNGAKAGMSPASLMARAGHTDFATTQIYIDLAGETFRAEAELLEARLWGGTGTNSRYKNGGSVSSEATETAALQD